MAYLSTGISFIFPSNKHAKLQIRIKVSSETVEYHIHDCGIINVLMSFFENKSVTDNFSYTMRGKKTMKKYLHKYSVLN